jgi:hypothetical protein
LLFPLFDAAMQADEAPAVDFVTDEDFSDAAWKRTIDGYHRRVDDFLKVRPDATSLLERKYNETELCAAFERAVDRDVKVVVETNWRSSIVHYLFRTLGAEVYTVCCELTAALHLLDFIDFCKLPGESHIVFSLCASPMARLQIDKALAGKRPDLVFFGYTYQPDYVMNEFLLWRGLVKPGGKTILANSFFLPSKNNMQDLKRIAFSLPRLSMVAHAEKKRRRGIAYYTVPK